MTRAKVILRDQEEYQVQAIAGHAAEMIQRLGVSVSGRRILVKPSFVYPSRSPVVRGIITQPEFIRGVLVALRELGAGRILVAESSVFGPSRVSFHSVGILPLLKGLAEPFYLDEAESVEVQVKEPFVQEKFRVPKIWLEADLYLSLPKIKTNMFAGLTLTIKNNLGMLRQYDRLLYHDWRLHKKLADLYKVRPPDMVIADCIIAGEGQGPLSAEPVNLGLILAGKNAVALDTVACHLAGYRPEEIEHLKLLIDAGYGPGRLDEIEIEQPELLSRARPFRRPSTSLADISPNLRVFQGTEFFCPSGCAGLIRGAMDAYLQARGPEGIRPMNVILGKPIPPLPDHLDPQISLVLGDCAAPFKDRGHFLPGCCPRPLEIGLFIRRVQGAVSVEVYLGDVMKAYAAHRFWRLGRYLSGKTAAPIENHLSLDRMIKEYMIMSRLRRQSRQRTEEEN